MIKLLAKIPYWYLLLTPWILIFIGSALNLVVEGLNHGQMPVIPLGGQCTPEMVLWITHGGMDLSHSCMNAASRWKLFADWINILPDGIASIGDLIVWAGQDILLYCLVVWIALMVTRANKN